MTNNWAERETSVGEAAEPSAKAGGSVVPEPTSQNKAEAD